ncbi:MAG: C40 family peptidase [candidate division SR1 bacterium]|nr:C40 family peptidase [candidate division SR1 bacterium]
MTQKELIKQAIALASQHIGVPYVRGGKDENGFDCSGLWLRVFSQMGIDFAVRFRTVEFFADAKPIALEQVQEGDVMFWHEEPGKTEHNFVYHIEMIVDKPFLKEGKWFVKTIGTRKEFGFDGQGRQLDSYGVAYFIREIDQRKSFGRFSYFDQILEYQKTGDAQHLAVAKPQEVKTKREL